MAKTQKLLHCFWEGVLIYGNVNAFEASLRKYCKVVSKNPDWDTCPESFGKYYSVRYNVAVPTKNAVALGKFLSTHPHDLHHYRFL